ncbi:MAG: histidine--tRNA ligase [Alphaproteobacteria bacterium]
MSEPVLQTKKPQTKKPHGVSGFPEWLPEIRLMEQQWLDHIRKGFESYGYANIETPAVELLDVLLAKGETDKEIYVLKRLQEEADAEGESRFGLHYDLTVPMARYVAQHFAGLTFPFKRYQMQKVWRGERPQEGRYREFYQCDIDVIAVDNLPLAFDAEMPATLYDVINGLGLAEGICLHISNRKILDGFMQGLSIADSASCIRVIDKMDKIGAAGVAEQLRVLGLTEPAIAALTSLASIKVGGTAFASQVAALGVRHALLEEGITELAFVMENLRHLPSQAVIADLSIARGFDYYTGTVYEGKLLQYPSFGSVVAGGRYDDLAGSFINKKLPGVGVSLGFSRLFGKMVHEGVVKSERRCPTDVLVVLPSEEKRAEALKTAQQLRSRGLRVETYHAPQKLAKQLVYAEKKGIPYVWFPPFEENGVHEVKNMQSGEQKISTVADFSLVL